MLRDSFIQQKDFLVGRCQNGSLFCISFLLKLLLLASVISMHPPYLSWSLPSIPSSLHSFLSLFFLQYHSLPHTNTQPRAKFPQQRRWINEKYRSPGPVYGGPSSIGKQVLSHTATAGGVGFGTSTRAGALKTYATYTV